MFTSRLQLLLRSKWRRCGRSRNNFPSCVFIQLVSSTQPMANRACFRMPKTKDAIRIPDNAIIINDARSSTQPAAVPSAMGGTATRQPSVKIKRVVGHNDRIDPESLDNNHWESAQGGFLTTFHGDVEDKLPQTIKLERMHTRTKLLDSCVSREPVRRMRRRLSIVRKPVRRMRRSLSRVRNEGSHNTLNDIHGCVEQPGGLAVSGSMEMNGNHHNSLNYLNKMNDNEHAMSVQKRKAVRPVHLTRAKAVRPVHSQRACYASHHEDQAPLRLVSSMSRLVSSMSDVVSMSAKLAAARKRRRNMVDDCLSMDKQQTFAEEQSKEVMASDRFRLVEAVMFECENYLKGHTGFEGFILWALVDSNGCFEQP